MVHAAPVLRGAFATKDLRFSTGTTVRDPSFLATMEPSEISS
jgi:hypothetical protein